MAEEERLRGALAATMDADMLQPVLAAIQDAVRAQDVQVLEDIVTNVLGDDIVCRQEVQRYAEAVRQLQSGSNAGQQSRNPQGPAGASSKRSPGTHSKKSAAQTPAGAAAAPAPSSSALSSKAVNVSAAKGKKGAHFSGRSAAEAALHNLPKKVFNCIGCGKVYNCRTLTSEAVALLRASGACLFCDRIIEPVHAAAVNCGIAAPRDASTNAASSSAVESEETAGATARAREFRDRLVDFDRNAAKRTVVIDDQGDYFEIDSNAWLSPEEKQQLKARQALQDRIEEERRKRISVTIDLLGRKVVTEKERAGDSGVQFVLDDAKDKAALAAAATRAAAPQGGGTGAKAADAVARGAQPLRELSMVPSVAPGNAAPVFVKSQSMQQKRKGEGRGASAKAGPTDAGPRSGGSKAAVGAGEAKGAWRRRQRLPSVGGHVFDQFAEDVEVIYQDTLSAEAAVDAKLSQPVR